MRGHEVLTKEHATTSETQPRLVARAAVLHAIVELLDRLELPEDERAEVLGGAFVTEAVRKHWRDGQSAKDAHASLRREDDELADAVEAISPMLLGRAHAREQAADAIEAWETALAHER